MTGKDFVSTRFCKPLDEITQADVVWLLFHYFVGEGFWDSESNAALRELVVKLFGEEANP